MIPTNSRLSPHQSGDHHDAKVPANLSSSTMQPHQMVANAFVSCPQFHHPLDHESQLMQNLYSPPSWTHLPMTRGLGTITENPLYDNPIDFMNVRTIPNAISTEWKRRHLHHQAGRTISVNPTYASLIFGQQEEARSRINAIYPYQIAQPAMFSSHHRPIPMPTTQQMYYPPSQIRTENSMVSSRVAGSTPYFEEFDAVSMNAPPTSAEPFDYDLSFPNVVASKSSLSIPVDITDLQNETDSYQVKTFPSEREDLELSNYSNSSAEASRVLLQLGSTLRSKADKFIDASVIPDPGSFMRRAQGKELFFPDRLYKLLEDAERQGWTDIISFQPHGRSFRVHDKHKFVKELLPHYMKGQGSWPSFLRQLRLYGFNRTETGTDYGAYYHELFLRSRPALCRHMRRVGAPHGGLDRRKFKLQSGKDPDFYKYSLYQPMPPLDVQPGPTNEQG